MRRSRVAIVVLVCGVVTMLLVASADVDARSDSQRTIKLLRALPTVVRVGEPLSVEGRVGDAPKDSGAALETRESNAWLVVGRGGIGGDGVFTLRWRVTSPAYRSILLRVVVRKHGVTLASTRPQKVTVGPAAVYCARPVMPKSLPPGDGWIVGGLYGEGGAYPGVYACISHPYTLTVTDQTGTVVATQNVGPSKSYTVILKPGRYALTGGCGSGSATVTAGRGTVANTYCRYP